AFLLGAQTAHAVERAFPGNSLAERTDEHTARVLARLRERATVQGAARIIVGLRVPFAPQAALDKGRGARQSREIASAQVAVLDAVPSLRMRAKAIKRFEFIPFMALAVT